MIRERAKKISLVFNHIYAEYIKITNQKVLIRQNLTPSASSLSVYKAAVVAGLKLFPCAGPR